MTKKHIARPASAKEIAESVGVTEEDRRVVNEIIEEIVAEGEVDFGKLLPVILAKVGNDKLDDLEAWKAAFPEVEFVDIHEDFSGLPIDWSRRSAVEKAAYVCYMRDPQAAEIYYVIDLDGYRVSVAIDDSEKAWWMWESGCLANLDDPKLELSEGVQKTLFHYAAQQDGMLERFEETSLVDDLELVRLAMTVGPFPISLDKAGSDNE